MTQFQKQNGSLWKLLNITIMMFLFWSFRTEFM